MFRITLSATSSNLIDYQHTNIAVQGSTIVYDGKVFDFSSLPVDSEVEAVQPASGVIRNINGVIHITLSYLYNSAMAELIQSANLSDYIFDISSGEVPCPIRWREQVKDNADIDPKAAAMEPAPIINTGSNDV